MRALVCFAFIFTSFADAGADPDPAKLRPTAEQTLKAESLVQKLASDVFLERDTASRELAAMGRLALGVIERVLSETDDAEVRSRCEALRPSMAADDLKARLEAFVADVEGKYDHKLPAWKQFREIVGNSAASRTLFTQFHEHPPAAKLLTASAGAKEEFDAAVVARRTEIYNRMYGRVTRVGGNGMVFSNGERVMPTPIDFAVQLFCETMLGTTSDRRYTFAMTSMVQQGSVIREHVSDPIKGELHRKLLKAWCDSRTESTDVYSAMSISLNLKLKELPIAPYAAKVLEAKTSSTYQKGYALTAMAQHGGKDNLPHIVKLFDDKTVIQTAFVNAQGQVERIEMQLRDVALAMAIITTEQKPEDYGFTLRNPGDSYKYSYTNYRLASEEVRAKAFKQWDAWRVKNPK